MHSASNGGIKSAIKRWKLMVELSVELDDRVNAETGRYIKGGMNEN